ncbi:type IV toxin-antitoxin system AbiEi family antitoxin domain-containing protein [Leucobacter luti]|uniref:type IV toxin-antitoxin system AbiEi family antitoxin domain-containing protein n=1 Tax=Leucobacter luti TaxID=340320 RepID=UPI003CFDA306
MSVSLIQRRGVMRTADLLAAGVSRRSIARALERGELTRPRRGWIAHPRADPELLFAAGHGLTIGCISQARRLGLWVRAHPERHFVVPRVGKPVRPEGAVLHWYRPVVPREPRALEDGVENVLVCVARCRPREDAVAIWDSALQKRLVDRQVLARLTLGSAAEQVLAESNMFADSGLESLVRQRLRWLGIRIIAQAMVCGRRVDFLLGERLVLQIDGGHHVDGQRADDNAHDGQLRLHGFSVIRMGYDQVTAEWPATQQLIMRAVAEGLHNASDPRGSSSIRCSSKGGEPARIAGAVRPGGRAAAG